MRALRSSKDLCKLTPYEPHDRPAASVAGLFVLVAPKVGVAIGATEQIDRESEARTKHGLLLY